PILSLNLKRLSQDWTKVYGHPIWLVETFVDPRFFKGVCYNGCSPQVKKQKCRKSLIFIDFYAEQQAFF
ncbi:DUF4338 domain-containing protein, partial [Escherichia coli]|nr:DUF4338 domain-containing protein [Escherichia coli]